MNREQEQAVLDIYRSARRQADERIILDVARTDEGEEAHVIRDELADPGRKVLWRMPVSLEHATALTADQKLKDLRDLRVIRALLAVGKEMERQDRAFLSAE